jgi:hypothetical protein
MARKKPTTPEPETPNNEEVIDFQSDLAINEHQLESEWLRQPQLMAKYTQLCADAELAAKKAHERVKMIRSELILEAANNPEGTVGSAKPTAAQVEAWFRTRPDYLRAKRDLHEAEHHFEVMKGGVGAMRHRRDTLDNLVRLYLNNYYASPRDPGGDFREAAEQFSHDQAVGKAQRRIDERNK